MFKTDFPIFSSHPDLIYLDSASSAQKPQKVIELMDMHMRTKYANIHRGAYDISTESESIYHDSKVKVAQFLGAKSAGTIVYSYNATYALNYLAQSIVKTGWLQSGDTILLSEIEHHANIVPWQIIAEEHNLKIEFIKLGSDGRLDLLDLEKKLTPSIKVVSISGGSNVTGELTPLEQIRNILHQKYEVNRPLFIVDGSQRFPHIETNVSELDIDFFVFTGHKVFSDTGLGILYGKEDLLREMKPAFCGGGAINSVSIAGYEAAGLPFRHEPGTPHIIGAGSLLAALEYIESIGGYTAMTKYEESLVEYALERFHNSSLSLSGVQLIGPKDAHDRLGVFSFSFGDVHPTDVAEYLADRNIAVRAGHHCTDPLHQSLGIGGSLRMSLSIYNTREDIERFFTVLEEAVETLG